jgi:hypothetical protein
MTHIRASSQVHKQAGSEGAQCVHSQRGQKPRAQANMAKEQDDSGGDVFLACVQHVGSLCCFGQVR